MYHAILKVLAQSNNEKGVTPVLILVAVVGILAFLALSSFAPFKNHLLSSIFPKNESQAAFVAPTPFPGCQFGNTTPVGQANPSAEYEPMGAIWCFPLSQMPTTRVTGANDWIDTFDTNVQMGRLDDGDMDYKIFNSLGSSSPVQAKHWINANHWMVDTHFNQNPGWNVVGGVAMRPNRSFKFENGKLIIEADVAIQVPELKGVDVWPEVSWSTAAAPSTGSKPDAQYGYGIFANAYSAGCRLQHGLNNFVCAGIAPSLPLPPGASTQCGADGLRMFETQGGGFGCVTTNYSNYEDRLPVAQRPQRHCQTNQMDIYCRDRFRFEWTKNGVAIFVNGSKVMEYSGLPASNSFPEDIANGTTPVYVYFGEHGRVSNMNPIRVHWDRIAVNPKDVGSHIMPPTKAPSFCPGQPQNTCPIIDSGDPQKPVVSKTQVDILDFVFDSPNITIKAGDTVTWTNKSSTGQSHSINAEDESWKSPIFGVGQTYSKKFDTPGTYDYYCLPHPNMKGKITVVAADGTVPSSTPGSTVAPTPVPSFVPGQVWGTGMDGIKNIPQITTNGSGTATLTLSQDEKSAQLALSYNNLTSTAISAHIHGPANTTTNAGIIFPLTIGAPGETMTTVINDITAAQIADLKAGLWYVNVHSTNYTAGEIRGQLTLGSGTPSMTPVPTVVPSRTPSPTPVSTPRPTVIPTQTPTPTVAPTPATGSIFGNSVIGSITDTNNSNFINGSRFTTTAAGGTVSSISVYVANVDSNTANRQYQVAIYNDSNGRPSTLLAKSGTGTLAANSWNTLPISATLAGNKAYWLVYNTNGRSVSVNNMKYRSGGQLGWSTGSVTFGTWPSTFGSSTLETKGTFSIYATLGSMGSTPVATPTPTPIPASKLGDVNGDGAVNSADVIAILGSLGQTGNNLAADVNKNGSIDLGDISVVIANWGT